MISVCLATFNGSTHVGEQLRSVLPQLGPDDEVVVADDGSTDDTLSQIAAMGDARIRVLASMGRLGVIRNFERVLAACRGDVIFLCDQDDVWLPGKVARCLAVLSGHPLVVTDCQVVDAQLLPLHDSYFAMRGSRPGMLHNLWRSNYLGCCMVFQRGLLDDALPFPDGLPMHDMWLGMLAEFRGGSYFLAEPLLLYRRHGHNTSDTGERSRAGLLLQARWRIAIALRVVLRRARVSIRHLISKAQQ